jgi:transposase
MSDTRRPTNVVLVAMANKTARVVWVLLSRGETFRIEARTAV